VLARGSYKVRLDDGSEIDLDLQAVKDWRSQGLLTRESPVLKPGSKKWLPLHQALGLQDLRSASQKRAAAEKKGETVPPTPRPRAAPRPQTWRTALAGILLIAAAAGAAFFWRRPERWLPALDRAPWFEISMALLLAALVLVRGWDWGRRVVQIAALLAAFVLFPLAGLLIVEGVRGRALVVLAAAWLLLSGLVALLSGSGLSRLQAAGSILILLAGAAGVGRFGLVEESEEQKRVRDFVASERSLTDNELGFTLDAREPWRLLRADQTAVTVPAEARAVLARPRHGGFAYLLAVNAPRGVVTVDDYLDRVLLERAKQQSGIGGGRHDVTVGDIQGRGVTSYVDARGVRVRDVTAAWRNGWIYYALVTWLPDDGSPGPRRDLEALHSSFRFTQTMARLIEQSVDALSREVPLLSRASAETLVRATTAQSLAPEQAFRRGLQLAAAGLPALPAAESQEIGAIADAAYASLSARDRTRLAAYLERVRGEQLTLPQEDREMAELMKRALLQLNAPRLARIQELYGKAIAAGASRG
jgi:hypothetical protein